MPKKAEKKDIWGDFEKQWKGVVFDMSKIASEPIKRLPSGVESIDTMIGGGFPCGAITELYGKESSGKTTLALQAAAIVTSKQMRVLFIDAEQSFSLPYAENLGVDKKYLLLSNENCTERALNLIESAAETRDIALIILDSIASLTPQAQLDGEYGAPEMGASARALSQGIKRIVPSLHRSDTALIAINQIRTKIGIAYGNPEYQPGGNAMKFYASLRLEVRAKGGEGGRIEEDGARGSLVTFSVVKNKTATPGGKAVLRMLHGVGFKDQEKE